MMIEKSKAVITISKIVCLFSVFVIVSNAMGALAFSRLRISQKITSPAASENDEINPLLWLLKHYLLICTVMILLSTAFLVSAVYLRKYKLWANRFTSLLSISFIIAIWAITITLFLATIRQKELLIFSIGFIANGILWSALFVFLISFLNKKNIINQFD